MGADAHGAGTNEARQGRMFRQHPGLFVFFAGLLALFVSLMPLALRDPDFRAAVSLSVNPLTSAKFLLIAVLVVLGCIIYIPLVRRMWRSAWNFELTADRLVATHQFSRRRLEIPWGSVAAVTRLAPSPLVGASRRQFSRIVLADRTELLFNPHLDRYTEFVDELRRRVTCRVFDPYPKLITG